MAKFCTNCGSPLKEGTKFCVSCGAPVAGSGQAAPNNSPGQAAPGPQINRTVQQGQRPVNSGNRSASKKSGSSIVPVIIAIPLIAIMLFVGCAVVLSMVASSGPEAENDQISGVEDTDHAANDKDTNEIDNVTNNESADSDTDTADHYDVAVADSETDSLDQGDPGEIGDTTYHGVGAYFDGVYVDLDDPDIDSWYVTLNSENGGYLYLGDDNQGELTDWSGSGDDFSMNAVGAPVSDRCYLKNGIMRIGFEGYDIAFMSDNAVKDSVYIVSEDEWNEINGDKDITEEAKRPDMKGVSDPGLLYDYLTRDEKAYYDMLVRCYEYGGSPAATICMDGNLPDESVQMVQQALCNDMPYMGFAEAYVKNKSAEKFGSGAVVYRVNNIRDFKKDEAETRKVVEEFASTLSGTTTEKVRKINDFIGERASFREEEDMDLTPYNALITGKACCQGYSTAFKAICDAAGIKSYVLCGTGIAPSGFNGPHAWNIVQLEDGNWYEIDTLWDDDLGNYDYFCIPTSEMIKNHKRDGIMYDLYQVMPKTEE